MRIILYIAGFNLRNNTITAQKTEGVVGVLSNMSISGPVDSYFRTNFNRLNKFEFDENGDEIGHPQASASTFANDPGFAKGMADKKYLTILSKQKGALHGALLNSIFIVKTFFKSFQIIKKA